MAMNARAIRQAIKDKRIAGIEGKDVRPFGAVLHLMGQIYDGQFIVFSEEGNAMGKMSVVDALALEQITLDQSIWAELKGLPQAFRLGVGLSAPILPPNHNAHPTMRLVTSSRLVMLQYGMPVCYIFFHDLGEGGESFLEEDPFERISAPAQWVPNVRYPPSEGSGDVL